MVNDLTALVLIGWRGGKWQVHPTFWLPIEGLSARAAADRVPYDLWHSQGHLQATPGKTVSYEFVAHHLRQLFQRYNIQKLAFDRWNFRHLKPWLLQAGFSEQLVAERFVEFAGRREHVAGAARPRASLARGSPRAWGPPSAVDVCESCRGRG